MTYAAPRSFSAALAVAFGLSLAAPVVAQEGGPPAMPVSVAQPVKRMVTDWIEFPGRFEASALVDVRAQISGALKDVHFQDGAEVKEGDLLFSIDPLPFEAASREARANLEIAKTRQDLANSELKRAQDLKKTGNIPEATFQVRQQAALEARGGLQAAEAALEKAELDLGYTKIHSPIAGKIGQKNITEGNLIASGTAGDPLTTIVTYDPIYFYFDIDEQSYLRYQRGMSGEPKNSQSPEVYVALADEQEFTHQGTLDFLSNQFDANTGTIRARATIANADGLLTPRMFGRIRIAASGSYEAFVVTDAVVMTDQSRKLVMTVGNEDQVQPKLVELGPRIGSFRVIRSGLEGTENVIVNGLMRARPGAKVVPKPAPLEVPDDLTKASLSR
jgi:RND family efflux transporter MFP subunit